MNICNYYYKYVKYVSIEQNMQKYATTNRCHFIANSSIRIDIKFPSYLEARQKICICIKIRSLINTYILSFWLYLIYLQKTQYLVNI